MHIISTQEEEVGHYKMISKSISNPNLSIRYACLFGSMIL